VKQNVVFLDKMFHIKGARWRLVPYVILEGRSPDRSESIKRDRSDAALFVLKSTNLISLDQFYSKLEYPVSFINQYGCVVIFKKFIFMDFFSGCLLLFKVFFNV